MAYSTKESDLVPGENPFVKDARLWSEGPDGTLKCELCPRYCTIADRKTGFCGTRYRRDGKLYAINYGLISSAHMDPYEKKPLYHYHPGKWVLSLGSFGCNMACEHCQNCEISQQKIMDLPVPFDYHPPEDILALCRQNVADGVSFTYNEPSIWLEYALECCKSVRKAGFHTSYVTNGYMTAGALNLIGPYIDAANVDVKGFNDRSYKEISHVDNPEEILARCEEMVRTYKIHIEITTNVIPGYNDSDETFRRIAEWIATKLGEEVPWHITRYHPANRLTVPATPLDTMLRGREIGRQKGLKFVYLGNIPDPEGDGTTCPACGRVVIERHGFSTGKINVVKGKCGFCDEELGIKM